MTSFLSEHQELFDADYVYCLISAKMVAGHWSPSNRLWATPNPLGEMVMLLCEGPDSDQNDRGDTRRRIIIFFNVKSHLILLSSLILSDCPPLFQLFSSQSDTKILASPTLQI